MKLSPKSLILLIISSIAIAAMGTSCRTVNGFGQDVEHTGDHISGAASR